MNIPIELHAKKNNPKTQSNPIIPINNVNIRKKVVFAPYLKKIVDYIITFTGTKTNMYRGLKDKAFDWQEGGVKPEWAGLLFPAFVKPNLDPGKDIKNETSETSKIYGNNMTIFKQSYMDVLNTIIGTKCDVAGIIVVYNEDDKVENHGFDDITDGNPGNWCGRHGKGKGDTDNSNSNLVHKYTSNSTIETNNLVHLVHWSHNSKLWSMVSNVVVNTVAQNKQHDLVMRKAPTHTLMALGWLAAWLVTEGELVMALDPDLQKFQKLQRSATSTWLDLRSSAASLTSRGSKSRDPPSSSGLESGPKATSRSCDLEKGKDLQNIMTLTQIIQCPKTHGLQPTIMPLTVRQVPRALATVWEGESLAKEPNNKVMNYSARNNVGLAGEWKYHLPKKGPKNYYRLVWVN